MDTAQPLRANLGGGCGAGLSLNPHTWPCKPGTPWDPNHSLKTFPVHPLLRRWKDCREAGRSLREGETAPHSLSDPLPE